MTEILGIVKLGCYSALFILIVFSISLVQQANKAMSEVTGTVISIHNSAVEFYSDQTDLRIKIQTYRAEVDDIVRSAMVLTRNAGLAAETANKASAKQAKYWDQSSQEITTTIANLNRAIEDTDNTLNRQLAPALLDNLEGTKILVATTASSIQATNNELRPVFENLALVSAEATQLLTDPTIPETLKHLDKTADNVEQITTEGVVYARRLTAPARFGWRVVLAIGNALGVAGSFIRGVL